MTKIWVIGNRPYPEKVVGGGIGSRGQQECDGTFFLDREGAERAAAWLNARDALAGKCWHVYEALLTVEKPSND